MIYGEPPVASFGTTGITPDWFDQFKRKNSIVSVKRDEWTMGIDKKYALN